MTNGHPTREEDFDLYVLGALEGDEKLAIESHLAGCADCARKPPPPADESPQSHSQRPASSRPPR